MSSWIFGAGLVSKDLRITTYSNNFLAVIFINRISGNTTILVNSNREITVCVYSITTIRALRYFCNSTRKGFKRSDNSSCIVLSNNTRCYIVFKNNIAAIVICDDFTIAVNNDGRTYTINRTYTVEEIRFSRRGCW